MESSNDEPINIEDNKMTNLDLDDDVSQMSVASEVLQRMFEPDHFDTFMLGTTEEEELAALDKIVQELNTLSYEDIDDYACDYSDEENEKAKEETLKEIDVAEHSSANEISKVISLITAADQSDAESDNKLSTPTSSILEENSNDVPKRKDEPTDLEIFKCSACVKEFLDEDVYNEHMAMHSNVSLKTTALHTQNESLCRKSYNCNICKITFKRKMKLICHILTHFNRKLYTCNVCQYRFAYKFKYESHLRMHTGEKPFECSICQTKFALKSNLTAHIKTHINIKHYTCNLCQKAFTKSTYLKNHLKTHDNDKPFTCDVCKSDFANKKNLFCHMKIHFDTQKHFVCNICDSWFDTKSHFDDHAKTHTREKSFECTICQKAFVKKVNLASHMKVHTGEKPFQCKICQGNFARKRNLINHIRIHVREDPSNFTISNDNIIYDNLVIPMNTAATEKQFSCNICDRTFAKKSNLNAHILIHTGEKPYNCNICQSRFARKTQLATHLRSHNVKKFKCKRCPLTFTQKAALKEHKKIHKGKK